MVVVFGEGRLEIGHADMVWACLGLILVILVLILNWLFYRPMFGDRLDRRDANPWQQYWGESYGPELKQRLLNPVFCRLETQENIGNLIIDVGSGASPVTRLVEAKPGRKRICVDIAADNVGSLEELRIRLDAEKVGHFRTLSFRKALLLPEPEV